MATLVFHDVGGLSIFSRCSVRTPLVLGRRFKYLQSGETRKFTVVEKHQALSKTIREDKGTELPIFTRGFKMN